MKDRLERLQEENIALRREVVELQCALAYALHNDVQASVDGDQVSFEECSCGCCAEPLSPDNKHIDVFRRAALSDKGE